MRREAGQEGVAAWHVQHGGERPGRNEKECNKLAVRLFSTCIKTSSGDGRPGKYCPTPSTPLFSPSIQSPPLHPFPHFCAWQKPFPYLWGYGIERWIERGERAHGVRIQRSTALSDYGRGFDTENYARSNQPEV